MHALGMECVVPRICALVIVIFRDPIALFVSCLVLSFLLNRNEEVKVLGEAMIRNGKECMMAFLCLFFVFPCLD